MAGLGLKALNRVVGAHEAVLINQAEANRHTVAAQPDLGHDEGPVGFTQTGRPTAQMPVAKVEEFADQGATAASEAVTPLEI